MLLLSICTSSLRGSVALHSDEKFLNEKLWSKKISAGGNPSHSELLTVSVLELLRENQKKMNDVTHLAVDVGPGSFTGIRVGVNFARAFAYARNLEVFVGDSLFIIANSFFGKSDDKNLSVQIPAFRNFHYYSVYSPGRRSWNCIEGPSVVTTDELNDGKFKNSFEVKDTYPQAKHLGDLALLSHMQKEKFKSWREITPLYIRRSEAEEKFGICL
ncbi:MAG: hypothetical protein A4S09_08530 [Proteobacteria bacterium SG_bin7]|nr:MAG: hypothetical protein A4S09_08530 [Proteobacteria bacterium SG_bin7]